MKTVRKAAEILTLFNAQSPSITVGAAARALDLTPSAVSRMLAALGSVGLVQRNPDRSYRTGPLAYRLGILFQAENRLADLVNRGARQLVDSTDCTSWVSVLSGASVMLLSRIPGSYDRTFQVDPGKLLPANASAGGKALLARMSDEEVVALFSSAPLTASTGKTRTDLGALLADIQQIRRRGWSIIIDELFEGISSIGVAFKAEKEPTPMAVSISIPSTRQTADEYTRVITNIVQVARELGSRINDEYWGKISIPDAHDNEYARDIEEYRKTISKQ